MIGRGEVLVDRGKRRGWERKDSYNLVDRGKMRGAEGKILVIWLIEGREGVGKERFL